MGKFQVQPLISSEEENFALILDNSANFRVYVQPLVNRRLDINSGKARPKMYSGRTSSTSKDSVHQMESLHG